MPTKSVVMSMVRSGKSYEEVGGELGLTAGAAYLIATGLPVDGSDGVYYLPPEREGALDGSTQHLSNPPTEVPKSSSTTEQWVRRRASSDRTMLEAAGRRTLEPPDVAGDSDDIVDLIGNDHNQVEYLQKELKAIPAGESPEDQHHLRRVAVVDLMRDRLTLHESAESECLWPAVRRSLPDGEMLASKAACQEKEGHDLLEQLAKARQDPGTFGQLAQQLDAALRKHVAFEDHVLLKFEDVVGEDERRRIGREYLAAKSTAAAPQREAS